MKIACHSLLLGGGYTIPGAVDLLARLGYDGVEWRVRDDFHIPLTGIEERAPEVKALCDSAGLAIPFLDCYLSLGQTEQIASVLRAAAIMGAEGVRVLAPQYDGTRPYPVLLEEARRDLARLEPSCREAGVKAVTELHMGNIIPSPSAAARLVEGLAPDCIGVVLDPGNMVAEGMEDLKASVEILGAHLAHVHVKNGGWFYSEELGWKFGWTTLRDGIVDWCSMIATLRASGYDGWLSVEDYLDIPIEQKAQDDIEFIRTCLQGGEQA